MRRGFRLAEIYTHKMLDKVFCTYIIKSKVSNNADQQTKEQTMTKITKEYANTNNGGKERVARDGDSYRINSYIPNVGWMGERKVSRSDVERCMSYTSAPADVVAAILS